MLRRVNGRPIPNNPARAYEVGRLDGTKDEHDTRSLEYLQQCLVELVEARNKGYIKISDIEKALRGEYKLVNSAE